MSKDPIRELATVPIICINWNKALLRASRCKTGGRAYKSYIKQAETLKKMALDAVNKAKYFMENVDNYYLED